MRWLGLIPNNPPNVKKIVICVPGFMVALPSAKANLLINGSFEAPTSNYRYVPGGSSLLSGWRTELNGVEIVTDKDIESVLLITAPFRMANRCWIWLHIVIKGEDQSDILNDSRPFL